MWRSRKPGWRRSLIEFEPSRLCPAERDQASDDQERDQRARVSQPRFRLYLDPHSIACVFEFSPRGDAGIQSV
jgi:hypothetical protein